MWKLLHKLMENCGYVCFKLYYGWNCFDIPCCVSFSHCPEHKWRTRAQKFKPSKKSIFSRKQKKKAEINGEDENGSGSDSEEGEAADSPDEDSQNEDEADGPGNPQNPLEPREGEVRKSPSEEQIIQGIESNVPTSVPNDASDGECDLPASESIPQSSTIDKDLSSTATSQESWPKIDEDALLLNGEDASSSGFDRTPQAEATGPDSYDWRHDCEPYRCTADRRPGTCSSGPSIARLRQG